MWKLEKIIADREGILGRWPGYVNSQRSIYFIEHDSKALDTKLQISTTPLFCDSQKRLRLKECQIK